MCGPPRAEDSSSQPPSILRSDGARQGGLKGASCNKISLAMETNRLSDKERALMEAARRSGSAPVSPLDAPTVVGWDHPAAQDGPQSANGKWAHIAALMDAERGEAAVKRRKLRRNMIVFLVALLGLVLIVVARILAR